MNLRQKNSLRALVIGVGLLAILMGAMTDYFTTGTGVIIAAAIWLVGIPILEILGILGDKKPGRDGKGKGAPGGEPIIPKEDADEMQ